MRKILLGILLGGFLVQSHSMWISGYYPGWAKDAMPPSAIDFNLVTHLILLGE